MPDLKEIVRQAVRYAVMHEAEIEDSDLPESIARHAARAALKAAAEVVRKSCPCGDCEEVARAIEEVGR